MLNRTQAPDCTTIDKFIIKEYAHHKLACGVDVYLIQDESCDVLRTDFYYHGGSRLEPQTAIATAASTLLPEGTSTMDAEAIANAFDFYGAYLQTSANRDESSITLYCLPKYFDECATLLKQVIKDAQYPENELIIYKQNALQSLVVKEKKTSYLAKKAYASSIFGTQHPYGKPVNQQDILNISRETVHGFGKSIYTKRPKYVIAAGNIPDNFLNELNNLFADLDATVTGNVGNLVNLISTDNKLVWVEKSDAKQSSVRMGKITIDRSHPDFRDLTIVNMLLGGFFGSRLMKNIREEKGLTYGIYSAIESQFLASTFTISVELNKDSVNLGIDEIRKELMRLRTEPVKKAELDVVKNYYLGSFLRGFDGVFSLSNYAKTIVDYNLTYAYYYDYLNVIQSLTPEKIMALAEKHLQEDSMITVVAGPQNA